jgi:hypothetical protein
MFTDLQLEAYLDEALPADEMARIEQTLRQTPELTQRLTAVLGRRDAGLHSLGEIWRRHRLSCPGRGKLGSYLLNVLSQPEVAYIQFHLDIVGCRFCQANLADLKEQQAEAAEIATSRRQKYFQSSAGLLRKR